MTTCKCTTQQDEAGQSLQRFTCNIAEGDRRAEIVDGVEYMVIPLVLAIADVEMNGAYIPAEEFHPESWNGRPVTLNHPKDEAGQDTTANSVQSIEKYSVGYLLNAFVDGDKLKADGYINVEKLNALDDTVINLLEQEDNQMDVSTGYYADKNPGNNNLVQHSDIKPDHLALLPYDEGACNFDDGCGVRVNSKTKLKEAIMSIFSTQNKKDKAAIEKAVGIELNDKDQILKANARSDDDDYIQMVADLISDDRSPFTADDWYGLTSMMSETLKTLRDNYLPNSDGEEDEPTANEAQPNGEDVTTEESDEPQTNANEESTMSKDSVLSNEDKAAVEFARSLVAQEKQRLVQHIVGNSNMTEEQIKGFDVDQLTTIANGLKPVVNYEMNGGNFGQVINSDDEAEEIAAMSGGAK